jgi:hypothetical protein
LLCGGFDGEAVDARVAVVEENERGAIAFSESAGSVFSIRGASVFGERLGVVLVADDPAPGSIRFDVDDR